MTLRSRLHSVAVVALLALPLISVTRPAEPEIVKVIPTMRQGESQAAIVRAVAAVDDLARRAVAHGYAAEGVGMEFDSILHQMRRYGHAPRHAVEHVRGYWRAVDPRRASVAFTVVK